MSIGTLSIARNDLVHFEGYQGELTLFLLLKVTSGAA
jgi:hypothetical protein